MSESFQEDRIREYLATTRLHYATYHNHKEHMAYTIAALYLVGVSALLSASIKWGSVAPYPLLLCVSAGLTSIVGAYVTGQLQKRNVAADIVSGCDRVRVRWLTQWPSSLDLWPCCYKGITMPRFLVDELHAGKQQAWGWRLLTYTPLALIIGWYVLFVYVLTTARGSP